MVDRQELMVNGPDTSELTLVLAHGAGAPMDSLFMDHMARALAANGLRVVRFEFDYMKRRRAGGRPGPPDRQPVLIERWMAVIEHLGDPRRLVIGGKSMGGRIASMVADDAGVAGLVCLGYPFHPPGRPDRLRTAHLEKLRTPTLIVQGTRDVFGSIDELAGYDLPPVITAKLIEDGDHSFKPRVKSGRTVEQNLNAAVIAVSRFVAGLKARERA